LVAAAVFLLAIGLAHSYLGERYILIRLFRRDLPELFGSDVFTKRTLRFAWHLTTVAWWGYAALLLFRFSSAQTSLHVVSVTFFVSAVVSFVGARGRHFSWVVFLAVAGLAWWAS